MEDALIGNLLDEELKRRDQKLSRQQLIDNAKRALELRRANEAKAAAPEMERATKTMKAKPKTAQIKSRAPKNPAKAGAVSQHTKNMQAKRDAK